jgi:hypothetical protein
VATFLAQTRLVGNAKKQFRYVKKNCLQIGDIGIAVLWSELA